MHQSPGLTVMIDLPPVARRSALRAGLSALRVLPRDMPADRNRHENVLLRLADRPHTVAFIDISRGGMATRPTLIEIDAALPRDATRQRVFLTRREGGHVSEADRRWVHALEFADLLPESAAEAVVVGQALGSLELLAHVTHDHPFLDDRLFYRLVVSEAADRLGPGQVLASVRASNGVPVADRSYLGATYPRCWIGAEAVDLLVARHALARQDACVLLHRLMQFGLIEHVTHERPFIDEAFYYHFTGLSADGKS